MPRIKLASVLAILSSFTWALWSLLIDKVDSLGKANYVGYTTVAEISVLILSLAVAFFYLRAKGKGYTEREKHFLPYAAVAGVFYGFGTIIFFSLLGGSSYPLVTSIQMCALIPFAFILAWLAKQKMKPRYVLGTAVALVGFVLQVYGLYGGSWAASYTTIELAVVVMVLYTVGYYFAYRVLFAGISPMKSTPVTSATALAVILGYGLAFGGYAHAASITWLEMSLAILVGVAVVIAYLLEEYAFMVVRKARLKYLDEVNILTNFELVWVIIFTAFFLSLTYLPLIAGLFLTFAGIMIVASA